VNLSGGLLGQGAAPGATGIAQTGTVAALLEGRYVTGLQPSSPPQWGVADTHGGVCTLSAVTVLCQPGAA
jgi:acetyl-CoA C-acetyltransferase